MGPIVKGKTTKGTKTGDTGVGMGVVQKPAVPPTKSQDSED